MGWQTTTVEQYRFSIERNVEDLDMAGFRHEYKYLCTTLQRTVLKQRMQALLQIDRHAANTGYYRIRSLYFDTPEDQCYYDNENGVGSRYKYRIRIYNGEKNVIVLEKKVKQDQMGYKRSCRLTEEECIMLIRGEYDEILRTSKDLKQNAQTELKQDLKQKQKKDLKQELVLEMKHKLLRPKVIVEYKRYPFVEPATNVRVTFDEEISSSNDIDHFLDKQIALRPVNPMGDGILEVKWDGILPDYIRKNLQLNSLVWSGYSKYYYCRRFNMYGGVRV